MVPGGSKGEESLKSTMRPVFLPAPCQVTFAPVWMHITASFGKFATLGVTDAPVPPPTRLTSSTHAEPFAPQVFAAVQSRSGCGFEQNVVLFFLSFATVCPDTINSISPNIPKTIAGNRLLFICHLSSAQNDKRLRPILPSEHPPQEGFHFAVWARGKETSQQMRQLVPGVLCQSITVSAF